MPDPTERPVAVYPLHLDISASVRDTPAPRTTAPAAIVSAPTWSNMTMGRIIGGILIGLLIAIAFAGWFGNATPLCDVACMKDRQEARAHAERMRAITVKASESVQPLERVDVNGFRGLTVNPGDFRQAGMTPRHMGGRPGGACPAGQRIVQVRPPHPSCFRLPNGNIRCPNRCE